MSRRGVRWWPAMLLVGLGIGAVAWIWSGDGIRQAKVVGSMAVGVLTGLALLGWAAFFSRIPWRARLVLLLAAALVGGLLVGLFEIEGVSGDLRPIVGWRWDADVTPRATVVAFDRVELSSEHDFPQFLGPDRDGRVGGIALGSDWELQPPVEVWRRTVGPGWAGFAVAGDLAITVEQRGDEEVVVAYDRGSGEPRWISSYPARYESTVGGIGPRTVPTVSGGRVFALGATGTLSALDQATGDVLWRRDVVADNGAGVPEWGKSCAPLAVDGLVVVSAGGRNGRSLVAYRQDDGGPAWAAGDDASSYSSPVLLELLGRPQIVIVNQASVAGHDPATGELLWSHPWPYEQPNVTVPVALDEESILVASGYGVGAKRLRLSGDEVTGYRVGVVWETPRLKSKFANLVVVDGFVYGLDDGIMVCLDPASGELCWKGGRYGHGQLLLAGDLILVQTEHGELVLVDPTPEAHRELARVELFDHKTWNPPALAGRHLVTRTHQEAVVVELPGR